eukprot:gene13244-13445_t
MVRAKAPARRLGLEGIEAPLAWEAAVVGVHVASYEWGRPPPVALAAAASFLAATEGGCGRSAGGRGAAPDQQDSSRGSAGRAVRPPRPRPGPAPAREPPLAAAAYAVSRPRVGVLIGWELIDEDAARVTRLYRRDPTPGCPDEDRLAGALLVQPSPKGMLFDAALVPPWDLFLLPRGERRG